MSAPTCRPIDASLARIVFCPRNLENTPFNYLRGSRGPFFSPSRLSLQAFLPLPLAGRGTGVTQGPSLPARAAADGDAGGGGGEEIWDPEVRGQGSSPDYRSIEEVSASQAST